MANKTERPKKKDIDMKEFEKKLFEFAEENFKTDMKLDIQKIKKHFGYPRNIIIEAYAFGSDELKKYAIIESKPASPVKDIEPPVLGGRGVITIKKQYIDQFNEENPGQEYKINDIFDVEITAEQIILKKR